MAGSRVDASEVRAVEAQDPDGSASRRGRASTWRELRELLTRGDFRRLLSVRLIVQGSDGVFQASLAGSVIFNPDRHNDPVQIALGFAVLLLPYSVLAPFAGVLIDRFSRRQIMVVSNLLRALLVPVVAGLVWAGDQGVPFFFFTLLILSVNRFLLSSLSAATPHVVSGERLVTANAFAPTAGTIAFAIGGGIAVGLRGLVGEGNAAYALIAAVSLIGCLAAAWVAVGFRRDQLGPDETERARRQTVRHVVVGMAHGLRHLARRRGTGFLLGTLTIHRILFGALTITGLLVVRNHFQAGMFGLGALAGGAAVGAFLAAVITPVATHRISRPSWVTTLLIAAAVACLGCGIAFTGQGAIIGIGLIGGTLVVALAGQGVKIVTDTSIQVECDDGFQGRVFSVNDTLFNTAFVVGLLTGALVLPADGRSLPLLAAVATTYLLIGGLYAIASRRWTTRREPASA